MSKRARTLSVLLVAAIVAVVGIFSLVREDGMTPYVDFDQARIAQRGVQILGQIVHDEVRSDTTGLTFRIADTLGDTMLVVYSDKIPANFTSATSVVCIGRYQEGIFQAERILVKCPSKYDSAGQSTR